jgi:phosphonate transport system substrate-binding protein
MKKFTLIPWLTLSLFLALGSGQGLAQDSLHLGLYPYLAATELVKKFSPLAQYLGQALQQPVILEIANSYEAHIRRMGKEELDLAFMGPISYIEMTERFGPKPILAGLAINGHATYQGMIVVKKERPFKTLADLKGKRFAFGSVDSTMGFFVPRVMLQQAGVEIKALGGYDHISNQQDVALGVLMGDYAAGAMRESVFKAYAKEGLRALATSQLLPEHLFVAAKRLGSGKVLALSKAMQALTPENAAGQAILASLQKDLTALVPAEDQQYQELRAMFLATEPHE